VVFVFQPAEVGPGGALPMIEERALDGVDFILGQHVTPLLPVGQVAISDGPALAASDMFKIVVTGVGGHGAYPHRSIDAIPIAAQIISAAQTIVSRTVDPLERAVVTIGTIQGGYNHNVIADRVEMRGTIRTFDAALREQVPARLTAIVEGIAAAHGGKGEIVHERGYPATINPHAGTEAFRAIACDLLGAANVHAAPPSMGGEDFAYYLQRIPGFFYWLGCKHPKPLHEGYNIHHPGFDLDEKALVLGAQIFVEGALRMMQAQ
jgi:amidohydrolase